jgi:two-component system chemotaxis response regulator CheB
MGRERIRVLVVDDSALMRKLLVRILEKAEDIEVVGTAIDGDFALGKIETLRPQVITLDLDMPRLNGLVTLRQIVERFQLPVVLVSSFTAKGADLALEGLALGAVDFVTKPQKVLSSALDEVGRELLQKIRVAAGLRVRQLFSEPLPSELPRRGAVEPSSRNPAFVVAIGISTGGPAALSYLLPRLRRDFAGSLLIVQHMPEGLTARFAERLARRSAIEVHEASAGERVVPGSALIAPGGSHLELRRDGEKGVVRLSKGAAVRGLRPSADVLFFSVAEAYGSRALGVIMTGMGEDGAEGLGAIRRAGGRTLAQDQDSSVVFGMPRAAIERGAVEEVLPLSGIADYLNRIDGGQGGRHEERQLAGID